LVTLASEAKIVPEKLQNTIPEKPAISESLRTTEVFDDKPKQTIILENDIPEITTTEISVNGEIKTSFPERIESAAPALSDNVRSVINLRALVSLQQAEEEEQAELDNQTADSGVSVAREDIINQEPFIDPNIPFVPAVPVAAPEIPVSLNFLEPVPAVPGRSFDAQNAPESSFVVEEFPGRLNVQIPEVVLKPVAAVPSLPVLEP